MQEPDLASPDFRDTYKMRAPPTRSHKSMHVHISHPPFPIGIFQFHLHLVRASVNRALFVVVIWYTPALGVWKGAGKLGQILLRITNFLVTRCPAQKGILVIVYLLAESYHSISLLV